jgi:hypothetical protein
MPAKDRAFSRLDREDLQDVLENADRYYPRKLEWIKARETKLVYLDELFSDLDLKLLNEALFRALLKLPYAGDNDLRSACSQLSAGLRGREMLYEKPQQVKERAPQIKALILQGYEQLKALGYGIANL